MRWVEMQKSGPARLMATGAGAGATTQGFWGASRRRGLSTRRCAIGFELHYKKALGLSMSGQSGRDRRPKGAPAKAAVRAKGARTG